MNVSVVIPAYNAEPWLSEALESVRDQTEPAEIIVVDDCSQDDTAGIARDFIDRNGLTGVVLSTERNLGVSNARNVGWEAASSDWIQFLDADDVLGPRKLERQIAVAKSAPDTVGVLYSPWQRLRPTGDGWRPSGQIKRSRVDNDTVAAILTDLYFALVGPTLVRKAALQSVRGFLPEMKLGEDIDLMLRIAMSGWRFRVVESPEPLFFYRDTPGSLWRRATLDCDAVMRCCRAVRSGELYLREHGHERMPAPTRRAIASRYRRDLGKLRSCETSDVSLVSSWIAELEPRFAKLPESRSFISHQPLTYTMDSARLRGKFVLRGTRARLRIRNAETSRAGGPARP